VGRPPAGGAVLGPAGAAGEARAPQKQDEQATLVGRFGARSRVRIGNDVEVAVDTRALHFFDPETGMGIYDGKTKGAAT